jgi:hypothetical protein
VRQPRLDRGAVNHQKRERKQLQRQPERLRPFLERADAREAMRHQGDDDQRIEQIAQTQRNPEAQFQRLRQDRRLQREEDEGEAGVDQRGDRRAEIAEARSPRQQVDVNADGEDRGDRVVETVGQRHRRADRLQRQKRDRSDRGVGHAPIGPLARAPGGEAQREILQRLVGDPLVIDAAIAADASCTLRHRLAVIDWRTWCCVSLARSDPHRGVDGTVHQRNAHRTTYFDVLLQRNVRPQSDRASATKVRATDQTGERDDRP